MGAGMRYQPQGLRRINRDNPLTRGLVFLAPMVGGTDLQNLVTGARGTPTGAIGTEGNPRGTFPSFTGSQYVDFPAFGPELASSTPGTVAWVQQPRSPAAYNTLLQFTPQGAAPFLVYQSTTDANYYFAAGRRGTDTVPNFGAAVGALTNGQIDSFVLTASAGFGAALVGNMALFRGQAKLTTVSTTTISASSALATQIGHLGAGGDPWRGLIGCVAIWNRVLSDAEARSYNANPWQLFQAPDEDDDLVAAGIVLASASAASSTGIASLSTQIPLAASASARSSASAVLTTGVGLSAAGSGAAAVAATLTTAVQLLASTATTSTAAATLTVGAVWTANAVSAANSSASLSTGLAIAATAGAASSSAAALTVGAVWAADAVARASASASLTTSIAISALANAAASSSAQLATGIALAANAVSPTSSVGTLTAPGSGFAASSIAASATSAALLSQITLASAAASSSLAMAALAGLPLDLPESRIYRGPGDRRIVRADPERRFFRERA